MMHKFEDLDPASISTVRMYDRLPGTFAGHFSGSRSCVPDIELAHELAAVPLGSSQIVEIGCGDGRDAENAFVPRAALYHGFDPSEGLLNIARARFPDAPKDMFQVGYAQTTDYPEDTDIAVAVNSILHVPKGDLRTMFDRVSEGLRDGGVFYGITKVEPTDNVEVYHDDFNGVTGERTFYYHSIATLARAAAKAGLHRALEAVTPVEDKPWDLGVVAYTK